MIFAINVDIMRCQCYYSSELVVYEMKKIIFLIALFIVYSMTVNLCPAVAQADINIIKSMQSVFHNIPSFVLLLPDCELYAALIILPLIIGGIYFFRNYLLIDIVLFSSSPLAAYLLNIIVKNTVRRPRPLDELQLFVHPSTYSFVSTHTFVTTTLWGLVIFYVSEYCRNKLLKISVIIFSVLWIIFVGFSRILSGVHNPTDVLGGYLLGVILVYIYVKLIRLIGGKC